MSALFVGLCTLDVIQLVDHVPTANEKLTARRQTVSAGGPATNAAVTFAHLGGHAQVMSAVGHHPLAHGIVTDLHRLGVGLVDLTPERESPPTVSSIMVTEATGARAVVSTNAIADRLVPPPDLEVHLRAVDAVQIDGHHMDLARAAVQSARATGRLTLLDAGSWKAGTEQLLSSLDVVACSADFRPPGVVGPREAGEYLLDHGVPWVAVTQGAEPLLWWSGDRWESLAVPQVSVVDTLAAGDIFHGALTHGLATVIAAGGHIEAATFGEMLGRAAQVASLACGSFGTRAWLAAHAA